MSKSFTIKKTDPQGLARLSNEIRLLWAEIEKLSPGAEVTAVLKKSVREISILGNALSVDKFLDEQGNYTALDSINLSAVKSGADSNNTSQSTLISAASSAGGGGGSSATSYATSADSSIVTVANSKDVSQSTLIAVASSAASLANTKAESASARASSVLAVANSKDISQSVLISVAQSSADAGGGGGGVSFPWEIECGSLAYSTGDFYCGSFGSDTANIDLGSIV